jgi:predicted RNase H-like HicB family nuclease
VAWLRKQTGSDFGVDFLDFPGCVTAGETLEEARTLAWEALLFHIEGMIADGAAIPVPSTLSEIMADPNHRDGVGVLTSVSLPADVAEAARDRLAVL